MLLEKQIFEVGGCVRDEILGVHTKDIDFTYVVNDKSLSVEQGFSNMKEHLANEGFKTFLETPDCFTIRAMFPKESSQNYETTSWKSSSKKHLFSRVLLVMKIP